MNYFKEYIISKTNLLNQELLDNVDFIIIKFFKPCHNIVHV